MVDYATVVDAELVKEFRDILVAERRRIVRTVFELRNANHDESPTGGANWGQQFKVIQDQIDAVDRAIADEERAQT